MQITIRVLWRAAIMSWTFALIASIVGLHGCGGGGGDAAEQTQPTSQSIADSHDCYYDFSSGRNIGEVGTADGEQAVEEEVEWNLKADIRILACNSTISIDQSTHQVTINRPAGDNSTL